MKHVNYFKPNIKPDSAWAERQWKWNWLRKMRKLHSMTPTGSRKMFVEAAMSVRLFTRKDAGRIVPKHASGP